MRHLLVALLALVALPAAAADLAKSAASLSDKDAKVRQTAADELWRADKLAEPYRPQLVKALDDPDANVVAYAAGALQSIGMSEAELAPARKRVLAAPEASTNSRFYAARNLVGYEAPMKLVGPMIEYLERNSQSQKNVELAEKALAHLVTKGRDRAIIQPLFEALVETKNGQIPLMKTLGLFDPKPEGWTNSLIRQLDNPNPRVRYEALGQMRTVKKEKDVAVWAPRASAMLQDPDASVRNNALWALGSAQGLAASEIDKVVAAASDPDPSVRRAAVRALGEMAEANQAIPAATRNRVAAAARPAIDKAMEDPDKDVRDEAKSALRNVGRGGPAVTNATPASTGNEAQGLAYLRSRKVQFDDHSYFMALQQLDLPLVHAFLDAGMSPNKSIQELGPSIRVMLFASAACSPNERPSKPEAKQIVKLLLERGADVNAGDERRNTAITEAASKGCDRELIRMLVKAGARIDATNASGLTPFEMGLWSGHDGLDELIAAGYRLPPDKVKGYMDAYKDRPAAIAMVKKASAKK